MENPSNLKVCLYTLGKVENLYAREFVEHYKKYDIDKIFIYDNNEVTGEIFDSILADYIILLNKIFNLENLFGNKNYFYFIKKLKINMLKL